MKLFLTTTVDGKRGENSANRAITATIHYKQQTAAGLESRVAVSVRVVHRPGTIPLVSVSGSLPVSIGHPAVPDSNPDLALNQPGLFDPQV